MARLDVRVTERTGRKDVDAGSVAAVPEEDLTPRQVVQRLLKKAGAELAKGELKGSLSDYVKLLQLEKELREQEAQTPPKSILVRWCRDDPGEEKARAEIAEFLAKGEHGEGEEG